MSNGQIDMSFGSIPTILPFAPPAMSESACSDDGQPAHAAIKPELPTLHEAGLPGYDRSSWQGLLAPAGTPSGVIARLNSVIVRIVNTAEMKDAFNRQGLDPATSTPEEFGSVHPQRSGAEYQGGARGWY